MVPELEPHLYGLRSDQTYNLEGLIAGCDKPYTLEQLQDILQQKYCGHIGAEFAYLPVSCDLHYHYNVTFLCSFIPLHNLFYVIYVYFIICVKSVLVGLANETLYLLIWPAI